jgi:hypothetical protein
LYLQEPEKLDFLCWTIEDEPRKEKVHSETRIPAGIYECRLRTWGRIHESYSKKFSGVHKGSIELTNVPGFSDILFHLGNNDDDTAGCVLPGTNPVRGQSGHYVLTESTRAYLLVYPMLANQLEHNMKVFWEIRDEITQ